MTKKTGSGLAALALLGWCAVAQALGLGAIEIKSGFNQPLLAEIPIIAEQLGEVESLAVSLASSADFARVGLDRPSGVTANLRFAVARTAEGDPIIRVTTSSPVRDPYLIFLIDAQWAGGRLVREYSVLIDPPHMAPAIMTTVAPTVARQAPPAAPAVTPPVGSEAPTAAPPAPTENLVLALEEPAPAAVETLDPPPGPSSAPPAPVPAEPTPESAESVAAAPQQPPPPTPPQPQPQPQPQPPSFRGSPSEGRVLDPVAAGQTLREIALRTRDTDVSVNQMMIALLNANRQAFINGNINLLKRGAILRIPERAEILALPSTDATALVAAQNEVWRQGRAGSAPVVRAEPFDGADRSAGASPDAFAASRQAPGTVDSAGPTQPDSPRLEIVAADAEAEAIAAQSGLDATGGGQALSRIADDSETGIISEEIGLEAMQQRLVRLEKIRADSERLLALRDQELAALQSRVTELEQTVVEQPWYNRPWTFAGAIVLVSGLIALMLILRRDRAGFRYSLEPQPSVAALRVGGSVLAGVSPETSTSDAPDLTPRFAAHVPVKEAQKAAAASGVSGRAVFNVQGPVLPGEAKPGAFASPDAQPDSARPVVRTGSDPLAVESVELARRAEHPDNETNQMQQDRPDDIGLDGSEAGDDATDESESVDSRLDLAQALIYMGDKTGARTLLEEVANGREPELARLARERLDELD
ncbi:MAG: FimV/HubP family polar landmark protein [Xanthomonadaceae bacterium]|nr:FimV/HubP family polar landmark protein [Xanthomonadaceae bacterium]